MPNKPVTVRRWEVVGALLLMVAVAVFGDVRSDQRIDDAERRINRNTERIADVAARNAAQDEVRERLLKGLQKADMRACTQDEAIKAEFREIATENFQNLERNAELLGIELTPALVRQAELDRDQTLARFAAREC